MAIYLHRLHTADDSGLDHRAIHPDFQRQVYVSPSSVKEKLDRAIYGKTPDFPWNTAQFLTVSGPGELTDGKAVVVNNQQLYDDDPVGTVEDEFDQSIRITLPTGCGADQDYDLSPTFHFQMLKVDNSNWHLILK